ncbi:glycosyltransferase [Methanobrevibacter olleyae]|uniref:Cell wall biosynthesis glycosyl transferase n=1 Tax=Methanobrevibacter olleyae TaxID=294671 RepID=A0A126R2B7_METOL|nr:glycosyltransferase [Methanobrevibacter olleyae]AMK16202.1 cell wall biosynthesis glycosyl transferase [Methanobrevibacter olleyae]
MYYLVMILVFLLASVKSTKNSKKSVSIVIPAFNEEATVAKVVGVASKLSYVDEVIVVDDGSSDRTVEEAESAGATVISHITNEGKGSAIKTGFKNSHGDIIAFIDADISNFTSSKIDKIIRPILEDKTDITKTKFARESGRVTELTAKPLLRFFFPELSYEQPLSGQFAGKRSALNKIRFEKDYGVDVGIVLDSDVHGIKILEVDIGDISHDMSPLTDLNKMANEVVRTIIDRAVEYGRVTMMDKLGNYIRMAVMGLSLIILGIFMIFFVPFIPVIISVFVAFVGIVLTIFYIVKIIRRSIPILKKSNTKSSLKSFVKMHFPLIVSGLILILMLSTFLSAATFNDGRVSVELTSRNFVYAPSDNNHQTISVRGPYTIDSAIENETSILRIPQDALSTLEISVNDTMIIDGKYYHVNSTRDGEGDTFRLPSKVKRELDVYDGEVIPNSRISEVFQNIIVKHNIQFNNLSDKMEGFVEFSISPKSKNGTFFNLTLDNESILSSVGNFKNDSSYSISYDDNIICNFTNKDIEDGNITFTYKGQDGMIEFKNRNNTSIRNYVSSDKDSFVQLKSL